MPTLVKLSENRLGSKTITENGTYLSIDENLDGYAKISVSVAGGGGGGSGLIEVSTAEEMDAVQTTANIGNVYKYTGETTDKYDNGALYILKQEGGNIALLTKDNINPDMGAPCQIYATPLQHPFVTGDKVDINFRVDGGEIQTITADYIEMDVGGGVVVQTIGDPNMDGMNMLVQTADLTVMYITYLNFNPFIESPDGGMGVGQVHAAMSQGSYIPDIEIVSFSKGDQEVINPVSGALSKPHITVQEIPAGELIATAKDIKRDYYALSQSGELIRGELTNPAIISSEEELNELLNSSESISGVYRITSSFGDYEYGLYQANSTWDENNNLINTLERLYTLQTPELKVATPYEVFKNRAFYDEEGSLRTGEASSPRYLDAEGLQEVLSNPDTYYNELFYVGPNLVEGYPYYTYLKFTSNGWVPYYSQGTLSEDELASAEDIVYGKRAYDNSRNAIKGAAFPYKIFDTLQEVTDFFANYNDRFPHGDIASSQLPFLYTAGTGSTYAGDHDYAYRKNDYDWGVYTKDGTLSYDGMTIPYLIRMVSDGYSTGSVVNIKHRVTNGSNVSMASYPASLESFEVIDDYQYGELRFWSPLYLPNLSKLIIRNIIAVPSLLNAEILANTPIATATDDGYIYVPDTFVDSMKTAAYWSAYADKIKPLSELEV